MRRLKVLVVDDHRLMLEAIRVPASSGRTTSASFGCVDSGETVVALVGQTGPHVVLLDVRMPGIDGLTASRRYKLGARAWRS